MMSDVAHSMSSMWVLSASDALNAWSRLRGPCPDAPVVEEEEEEEEEDEDEEAIGGGLERSNFRRAAAVSSLAAPPAPAAANSGRNAAGASKTGKCFAMNAAASGRATPPPNPLQAEGSDSEKPAGRK